jgi:hypothetical protein
LWGYTIIVYAFVYWWAFGLFPICSYNEVKSQ